MARLLGRIEEKDAWIRALEGWDNGHRFGVDDIIDDIRQAESLSLELRNRVARRHDVVKRLIDVLGVWFPVAYYQSLPVIYPYIVRDPRCRQNRNGRPEAYCSPNRAGFMRADNTPVKQLVEGRQVTSPFEWYCGNMRRGFVASHAWRRPVGFEHNHVLASRDPWLNTFVPNLCWLPSALSKLTDDEGSFAQHYLQAIAITIYRHVHFEEEQMQLFVDRLWDRLPVPEEIDRIEVPDIQNRGTFRMRQEDVEDRIRDLGMVVSGLRDALDDAIPSRIIIHHRYTLRKLRERVPRQRLTALLNNMSSYMALLVGGEGGVENYQVVQDDATRQESVRGRRRDREGFRSRRTYDVLVDQQVIHDNLPMRPAALCTIQQFVEMTPGVTFEALRNAFPKRVNRRHETVILADDNHDPRRYLGPINLDDGRRICVCGEWIGNGPRMNWHLFVAAAAAVGIDIIEHEAD